MNKDVKKQLWLSANKLRGDIPVESIVKVMVFSLLLKYIEGKHINEGAFLFFDEKYAIDFLHLIYGKKINAADLSAYLENAEQELGISNGVISKEFMDLISMYDPEKINNIWNEMEIINSNDYRECYDTAVYLLEQTAFSMGRLAPENMTNPSVAKLIANILDCKHQMTVYDGFGGCGVLSATVAANNGTVYIQDINMSNISIATVLSVLNENKIGKISCGDTLLNPLDNTMKYDLVVIDPPLGMRYDSDYMKSIPTDNYFDVGTEDKDSIFVRHAIARMKDDGMAAVIVPMGALFKSGRTGLAREVYASQFVDAVIELPEGTFTSTSIAAAILILKKKKRFDDIFMISAKSFADRSEKKRTDISSDGIDKIVHIYKTREIIDGISNSVSHSKLVDNEYNMCTMPYVTTTAIGYSKEKVEPFLQKYAELSAELKEIEIKLNICRERFYE